RFVVMAGRTPFQFMGNLVEKIHLTTNEHESTRRKSTHRSPAPASCSFVSIRGCSGKTIRVQRFQRDRRPSFSDRFRDELTRNRREGDSQHGVTTGREEVCVPP